MLLSKGQWCDCTGEEWWRWGWGVGGGGGVEEEGQPLMREWEEGSEDHLITAPSTSTYQATAKPSLMARLCRPGYYFRHGGIN